MLQRMYEQEGEMKLHIVGKKGRVTIPREIRSKINLREGDHVFFTVSGNRIILESITKTAFDLRGSVEVSEPQDFAAIRKKVLSVQD